MKGNVIILGAGTMQIPAIACAESLGYNTVVLDADRRAEGAGYATRFEHIDIKDEDAVRDYALRLKRRKGVSAVFTAGTDFSASVSLAAEACSLPAHRYIAAKNASDKVLMRQCFKNQGVASPEFFELSALPSGETECLDMVAGAGMDFPLVVKPVDNMGARGCRMVRSEKELLPAVRAAHGNSRTRRVIVEKYMEGPEFSIDALVYDGSLTVCGFADRHIFYPPYFIEMGHTMPTEYDPKTVRRLIAEFARGVYALGLSCGAAKGDIKLTADGPMIGEIAARLSGGYMSGWTFPYASGLNLTQEALLVALGKTPEMLEDMRVPMVFTEREAEEIDGLPLRLFNAPCSRVCAERAWISIPGAVARVSGKAIDEHRRLTEILPDTGLPCDEGVQNVFFRSLTGDAVDFPRNNVQKCGNVITIADTREQAEDDALSVVRGTLIRLKPHNERTDAFLLGGLPEAFGFDEVRRQGEAKREEAGEEDFPPDAYPVSDSVRALLYAALESAPPIPEGEAVEQRAPRLLSPYMDEPSDWNSRSLRQTLIAFDKLCPDHREIPALEFWHALLRGGLQGILYIADSI
jgi:biotin carboxylase